MNSPFFQLISVFILSFLVLFMMRKVGLYVDLVDRPTLRKKHAASVPLVGGISISVVFIYFLYISPELFPHHSIFIFAIAVLTIIGALDDKFELSVKVRLFSQATLSIVMMHVTGIGLHSLGNMFGFGVVDMHGYIITILAVVGAINAFNMVDGLDGLLGGLSIVTFSAISYLLTLDGQTDLAFLCLGLIVIISPYVILNLGLFGSRFKIFMGDAGSMLIGFTVIWLLLLASQNKSELAFRPVTALWLIAVPLMDMAATMIRRIRRKQSPFKPDREHLHHIFERLGFTPLQTLFCICTIASAYAAFGIYGELSYIPEYIMFYLFIGCFLIYLSLLSRIWRITTKIRAMKN